MGRSERYRGDEGVQVMYRQRQASECAHHVPSWKRQIRPPFRFKRWFVHERGKNLKHWGRKVGKIGI